MWKCFPWCRCLLGWRWRPHGGAVRLRWLLYPVHRYLRIRKHQNWWSTRNRLIAVSRFFLCNLPIDFWSEMWYNNRGVEVRPTMVEIAGILKKSSISQFFPSIFAFPNICSVSRNYVNRSFVRTPFLRSGHRRRPYMAIDPIERAAKGRGGPSSDRLTPYGKFFYWKWSRICPDKIPKSPIWPISVYKADRLIIILSHYNYNIFFNKSQATGARLPDR